jgi:uncharacterized radical SAM superfamily Fe-S cluster-containing enzyme
VQQETSVSTQTFTPGTQAVLDPPRQSPETSFPDRKRPDFKIFQPETTHSGSAIEALQKGLPKITTSLCPECTAKLEARIFEENGRVIMEKTCAAHGQFRDIVFSDAKLYLKMEQWHFGDNRGVSNPAIPNAKNCPDQCGLCSMHVSHTALANLDLTNRCNLTCPVCFANANAAGTLYEPSFDEVRRMLQALRDTRPVAGRVVQFSGGEPTVYPRFLDACRMAREMGFTHIQAATNGILMADLDFTMECKQAGLNTIYLQFDGVCEEVYLRTRGESLLQKKLQVIENCRQAGIKICFVPTIVKGLNDHQVGDIVQLAIDNIDVVSAISFQPVAFTGRINRRELEAKRFTLSDLAGSVSEQTGLTDAYHDWFPLACVTPFSRLLSAMRGEEVPTITCHPHCSVGTYLFVNEQTREAVPVTRFVDVGAMLQDMEELSRKAAGARVKFFQKFKAFNSLHKRFIPENAPTGLNFTKFLQTLQGLTDKKLGRDGMDGTYTYRTLLVAGMHFMDNYNYDTSRVKRCVIHYAAPNGLLYPFCAYNAGPTFRDRIEKKYSMPFEKQFDLLNIKPNGQA